MESFEQVATRTSRRAMPIIIGIGVVLFVVALIVLIAVSGAGTKTGQGNGPVAPQDTNSTLGQTNDQNSAASGSMEVTKNCAAIICNMGDDGQIVSAADTNGAYQTTMGDCNGSFTPNFGDTSANPTGTCMPKAQTQSVVPEQKGGLIPGFAAILGVDTNVLLFVIIGSIAIILLSAAGVFRRRT